MLKQNHTIAQVSTMMSVTISALQCRRVPYLNEQQGITSKQSTIRSNGKSNASGLKMNSCAETMCYKKGLYLFDRQAIKYLALKSHQEVIRSNKSGVVLTFIVQPFSLEAS